MSTTTLAIAVLIAMAPASPQSGAPRADSPASPPTLSQRLEKLRKIPGFFPLYWDGKEGKLLLEIGRLNAEFLYQVGLTTGLGSNPVGLDRGQLGGTHLVKFWQEGPRVLLLESNYRFRALSNDPAERRTVQESFARSVLWGFKLEGEENGRLIVDATDFFLRDAHGVVDALKGSKQGNYRLDPNRSAFYLENIRGFPKNTEVEALLTFQTDDEPGPLVAQTTPYPKAVTLTQHHSLVELPPLDGSFRPRRHDPRVGNLELTFADYATPLSATLETRWILRHRLVKKDPKAAVSEPVEPIVYHVDPGAPEPIRSALIEGASWWRQAFEAAGFRDAFKVVPLPSGADPMDLRYNMVHWVHRATRGWSYGNCVVDPRTGEILKGNVTLGSLRGRQDFLLASGLVNRRGMDRACLAGLSPDPLYLAALDPGTDPEVMSLARLRQLAAHEVGHAIGLSHNFAASTYGGRASVMDYPAPLVRIKDGKIDLSGAYARGIGAYDALAIAYGYYQFAPGTDEARELERILRMGLDAGMLFVSDADARPAGAAHPLANLWDNGTDPVATLRHELEVRRIGLASFGLEGLGVGQPLSLMEARLLPLYLHHRYQLNAAVKSIGGVAYSYAVKTPDGPSPKAVVEPVSPARQREALGAVLETLNPEFLLIPDRVLALIPPRADSDGLNIETFAGKTAPVFDPVSAAVVAADLAIRGLLQPERAARLVWLHGRDAANPDFIDVVDALVAQTWGDPLTSPGKLGPIRRAVQSLVVQRLIELAGNEAASSDVRAIAADALERLHDRLEDRNSPGIDGIHLRQARTTLSRFLRRTETPTRPPSALPVPPGDPIGGASP